MKALQEALIEGEESGEPESFDFDEFLIKINEEWDRSKLPK